MPYMMGRREILHDLFLPATHAGLFGAAAALGLTACVLRARRQPSAGVDEHPAVGRVLIALVHGSAIVLLVIGVGLPLVRVVGGIPASQAFRPTSAAHTWIFVLALLYVPWVVTRGERSVVRYVISSAVLLLAATAAAAPSSGGAQFSPRFFLPVTPLLAVAAATVTRGMLDRRSSSLPSGGAWMARVILLASLVMAASGVIYFQRAKTRWAALTHSVADRTADGEVLITDIFWFHEVTATLSATRRQLFSWSSADIPAMAAQATDHGLTRFSIVSSVAATGYQPPAHLLVPRSSCRFARTEQIALDRTDIRLSRYECTPR